ncbi:MAG: response regulator [Candidatus Riflebacteria bacterium]|nr:response regulator [Candidatus Riflebacteria bacterium]
MEAKRQKVLVVDDILDNIEVMDGILRSEYEVKMALNGSKALKIAMSEDPPDLILLDIMMPDMDGYEVCRQLKSNPKTRMIPVVFVTAKNEDIDEVKGLQIGAVDYLTKPVSPGIVAARVKTHLSLAAARKELERQNEILRENACLREDVERITRHDLKSPISAFISIPSILARDKNLTPDQVEMLNILNKSGLKMLEMINRSLDLIKMERGQYSLNPVPVDLVKVVRQIIAEFNYLVSVKNVKILFTINGEPPSNEDCLIVQGEEYLFFSMLSNLIKNAIEASPEGRQVSIAIIRRSNYFIEIGNQGEIPAEIRDRFFDRYVTFGKKRGTGLGVYSARLMAKTLGGELSYRSSKEAGTILVVEIPHKESKQDQASLSDSKRNLSGRLKSEIRVLVVDDYDNMRKIISEVLRQMGCRSIYEAASAFEAQEIIAKKPMDLVIASWDLSDKSELEILKALRAKMEGDKVPLILISASINEENLPEIMRDAIENVVAKPFSADTLRNKIETVLSKSGSIGQS